MAGRGPSEDSDEEFQESQYTKLQNNYRHAREDQREYTIEKKDQLRMQSKTLQQLTRERDELDKVYRLAESLENQKRDDEKTRKLQELVRTKDELNGEIQNEKSWSRELDEKLHEWEKKFHRKQMETGGANVSTTFNVNARRQERVLENRLDTTLKRFNTLLKSNASSRSEIDTLRVERQRYEDLYQKSEKSLRDLREKLLECIERSVNAYDIRKDANSKAIILQNKADMDKTAATIEMKELERQISHDQKLHEFMKLKSQERQEDEELVTHRKEKEADAAEKRRRDKEEHSIEAYEVKFKRLQDISGEHNLQKLVDRFIQVEDKNFALFNYVNELSSQAEMLQEQISNTKKAIARFESQGLELDDQRKVLRGNIDGKRTQVTGTADQYQEKTLATRKTLDQCRTGIDSLFKKIGCDRRQIDQMLQSHEGVTDDNMLRYLGVIEERTNELLTAQATIHAKEQNLPVRDRAPNLIGDGPAKPVQRFPLHLPNTDDRRDADEKIDDLKPLTREELRQRAYEQVHHLERKALQEQNKYNDMAPAIVREKSSTGMSRSPSTGKLPTARTR